MKSLTWPLMIALLTLTITSTISCGKPKKDNASNVGDDGDGNNKDGKDSDNPSGLARDGLEGSDEPRPAACTTCDAPAPRQVAGCPEVIGQVVPCEGFCFVKPTVEPLYLNEPPASGPAYPSYDTSFSYEKNEIIPRGTYVHNLAHGYIIFAYNCPEGCEADLAIIRKVVRDRRGNPMLITQDPLLKSKFAAIAWSWAYTSDKADEQKLKCFLQQHVGTNGDRRGYPH